MAKLEIKIKENPKLQQKALSDGRLSLYLEYYLGRTEWIDENEKVHIKHDRKKEFLNLYLTANPRTPIERNENNQILEIAKEIRIEREQELKKNKTGKRINTNKKINLLAYFEEYYSKYNKKDIRMIRGAIDRFNDFLKLDSPQYRTTLRAEQLNKEMIKDFVEYLESRSTGEGAHGYFQRFKKIVNYAVENNVIIKNPCTGVVCKVDENALTKDILSIDEIKQLIKTRYPEQNPETRRAFIFTLYTGIRFCDIIDLKFSNVDYSNRILKFNQAKTKGKSSSSWVNIPLNDYLLSLIGEKTTKNDFIFNLPSHTMCLKTLRVWVKKAGIDKHITWHCGRHSYAVNILNNGANIKTVASLLGHSGLKHTEKYTRAVDSLKEQAVNSLPTFEF